MEYGGSESWCFAEGIEEFSNAALYVRDAIGLTPPPAADIPPCLTNAVPDLREILDAASREEAGTHWPEWWRAVIAMEAEQHLGRVRRGSPADGLVDPTRLATLDASPALHHAVQATFDRACRWVGEGRRHLVAADDPSLFEWGLVRDTAEEVAARYGVRLGTVRGCAIVLMVDAKWWANVAPGVIACSVGTALDREVGQAAIRTAFESALKV